MTITSKSSTPLASKASVVPSHKIVAGSALESHVALLRGINVGGKNKLPMKALAALFVAAGCSDVRTYIQSGNVVFTADPATVRISELAGQITASILTEFGLKVPMTLRSAAEIAQALEANPFIAAGIAEDLLHVYFLADAGSAAAVKGLDYGRSMGDTFVVSGREIYLHLPHGTARTKLTNVYFDRQLGTVSTLRNWRTVRALGSWMEG